MPAPAPTIRAASSLEAHALASRGLDSRPRLGGGALLAERDGVAVAAVALTSGSVLADPSLPTAEAVRLLRLRRYQLLRQGSDAGPAWSLLRRVSSGRQPHLDTASLRRHRR
jgi:hypothetical protein